MNNRLVGTGTNAQDTRSQTVLIAHSMRLHREVTAFAFNQLRPNANVVVVKPTELAVAAEDLDPVLVVSDVFVEAAMDLADAWVLLDPAHPQSSTVSIDGEVRYEVFTDLDLILRVFDQSVRLRSTT